MTGMLLSSPYKVVLLFSGDYWRKACCKLARLRLPMTFSEAVKGKGPSEYKGRILCNSKRESKVEC